MLALLQQMQPGEQCVRGAVYVLPPALQQRYYQLAAPHCTKAANILVYIYKLQYYHSCMTLKYGTLVVISTLQDIILIR